MKAPFSNPAARRWVSQAPRPAVRDFHRSLPGYVPTALRDLPVLANELGIGRMLVKDESARLGLPAFKILGASWACHQTIGRQPGAELVTATDGNHGRAVARMAVLLNTRATVFVPSVMLEPTARLIEGEGATVHRVNGDYDVAVAAAAEYAAAAPSRALVQDTAWPGYTDVPQWIVDGYETLLEEVDEDLGGTPDLVVVPVGVGSLLQAVITHYRRPGMGQTRILSVEPATAAGVFASVRAGEPTSVPTSETIMAGLNCGTVSSAAWPVIRNGLDAAVVIHDDEPRCAMAALAAQGVHSGPCGAATLAGLTAYLETPGSREAIDLPDDALVVLISTEGASE